MYISFFIMGRRGTETFHFLFADFVFSEGNSALPCFCIYLNEWLMKVYNIGIIGTGWIAEKMAITLGGMRGVSRYAVASRSKEKAEQFAREWQFTKAYGSYEELADDPDVDLVYIATPHSHHYSQARMCIAKGKPVLCEKAFTANARQAEDLLAYAKEQGVFITEAIWTRYMPLSLKIQELVKSGVIGTPYTLSFRNRCGTDGVGLPADRHRGGRARKHYFILQGRQDGVAPVEHLRQERPHGSHFGRQRPVDCREYQLPAIGAGH